MIDTTGVEWLTVAEAARTMRVRAETIRTWATRGKVTRCGEYVNMPDMFEAEHAWRDRLDIRRRRAVFSAPKDDCP